MRMRIVASIAALAITGLAVAQNPATPTTPAAPPTTPATTETSAPATPAAASTAPPDVSTSNAAPVASESTTPAAQPSATDAANAAAVASADPAAPAMPGNAEAGATKAAACGACHGPDGNATDPQYPKIAGQHEAYMHRQLQLFKDGGRESVIMVAFAAPLSAQDMRDIGAYFATQKALPGVANEAAIPEAEPSETWVQRGARLYRGGDAKAGTPACMACHGPTGRGTPGAYPAIAGQHADYTKLKLAAFRDGTVWGKDVAANPVMADVAKHLTDTDIEALATYIEGLHAAQRAAAR